MAEFVEVARRWNRMCEMYDDCSECPLDELYGDCETLAQSKPQMAE